MRIKATEFFQDKWRKRAFWIGVGLLIYALIGFLLVPWILGKVIPKQVGELLDRRVKIEKVRINPFALSGSLQGFLVEDKDGTPLLSWDEVYANFQLSSIFHWAFTFKEVRIVRPFVHFQINPDYTFNVSDIIERLGRQSPEPPANQKKSIPALRVDRLLITNAVAKVSDLTLREPFHRNIGPVNLTLKEFYTDPHNDNPYSFAGSTEAGERFAWSGQFYLSPLRSEGQLNVEGVRIAAYAPFYRDFVTLTVRDGVINVSGDYRVRLDGVNDVLSVSNLTFHLASLKVKSDADTTADALEVDDLKVSGVQADLRTRTARVGDVSVSGGQLFVHRKKDAGINLVEMAQPSNTNAQPAGAILYAMQTVTNLLSAFLNTTNQGIAVVDHVEANNCAFQLEDDVNTRPVRLRIDGIQVRGTNLSNIPGEDLALGLQCRWNTNGTIKVNAAAKLFPIQSDIRLQMNHVDLPPLGPYAEPFLNVLLVDSKFNMDGVAQIRRDATDAPFNVDFAGNLSLDDFSSVEGLMGTDLLEWKSAQLSDVQASLHPLELHIGQVAVLGARARLMVETNRTINVLNALSVGNSNAPVTVPLLTDAKPADKSRAPSREAPPLTSPERQLPVMTVSSVLISNAVLDLVDASTVPPLRWSLTDINGDIGRLSSTNLQRANLRMSARAGGTAPVEISGELNPLNPAVDTDITIKLANMDLLPFGPYSERYVGYQLRRGHLSLDLKYDVQGRRLDLQNRIVVNQLALGRKVDSPEATKLPVKLGVAILKDRNGVIDLDVPVRGDLNDPEFRLGRLIGHTVMITLTKMLSSPFSLLGAIVGGSGAELSSFDFLPGSAVIQPGATNGLQKLSKALYERPGLEVEIQGSVAPRSDALAIKKQKLTRTLRQLRWEELRESARANTKPEDIALSPDLRIAMLRKYYVQVFPDEARHTKPPPGLEDTFYERMTNKLLDQIEVTDEDFDQLALARAQGIKSYLVEQGNVDPARLFLTGDGTTTVQEGSKALLQLQ